MKSSPAEIARSAELSADITIRTEIEQRFPDLSLSWQATRDAIPTVWVPR